MLDVAVRVPSYGESCNAFLPDSSRAPQSNCYAGTQCKELHSRHMELPLPSLLVSNLCFWSVWQAVLVTRGSELCCTGKMLPCSEHRNFPFLWCFVFCPRREAVSTKSVDPKDDF